MSDSNSHTGKTKLQPGALGYKPKKAGASPKKHATPWGTELLKKIEEFRLALAAEK